MNELRTQWSDGKELTLAVGQTWDSGRGGEGKLTIVELTNKEVTFQYDWKPKGQLTVHDLNGSDGFIDYLESCCFKLEELK